MQEEGLRAKCACFVRHVDEREPKAELHRPAAEADKKIELSSCSPVKAGHSFHPALDRQVAARFERSRARVDAQAAKSMGPIHDCNRKERLVGKSWGRIGTPWIESGVISVHQLRFCLDGTAQKSFVLVSLADKQTKQSFNRLSHEHFARLSSFATTLFATTECVKSPSSRGCDGARHLVFTWSQSMLR